MHKKRSVFSFVFILVITLVTVQPLFAEDWAEIEKKAKGQTVYFNGWGGSDAINDYIRWAASEVEKRFQIKVKHVKVTDIAEVVGRILVEKSAGRENGGSVDLMWINGENFNSMKKNQLLLPAYSQMLPHYPLIDIENKRSTLYDFTVPVENLEVPWGMAQLVFLYDTKVVSKHPENMNELLDFAKKNPGRVTYPAPPNFHGTTFLKQALLELAADKDALYKPVNEANFNEVTQHLWKYLDELHMNMWRKAKSFPANAAEMKRLLSDGEIFISLSFNPSDASNAIATGELPDTVRTYVHDTGTIGNTHFVAIPFNSSAREAALVFANFLISVEAQARKSDPAIWGDPTVLALSKLDEKSKKIFTAIPKGVATLSSEQLGKVLLEPHASWVAAIEKTWLARYSK